jgi:uncharacterized membrane protein YeiH
VSKMCIFINELLLVVFSATLCNAYGLIIRDLILAQISLVRIIRETNKHVFLPSLQLVSR